MRLPLAVLVLTLVPGAAAAQEMDPNATNPYGPPPTPPPTDTAEPATPDAAERPRHEVPSELFEGGVGVEAAGRFFHYTKSPGNSKNIRPYDSFPVAMPWVGAQLYPAALTDIGVLKDLGFTFSFAKAFGVTSTASKERTFSTAWNHLTVGLRYRIDTGAAPSPMIGFSLGYGSHEVQFEPNDAAAEEIAGEVASVHYQYLRLGADLRADLGAVALVGGLGYRANVGAGEVYDRFTPTNRGTQGDASIGAIDLSGGLGVEIMSGVEGRFVAEYARYFYSFEPVPGDQYIAGGALDQFLSLRLTAVYIY